MAFESNLILPSRNTFHEINSTNNFEYADVAENIVLFRSEILGKGLHVLKKL